MIATIIAQAVLVGTVCAVGWYCYYDAKKHGDFKR